MNYFPTSEKSKDYLFRMFSLEGKVGIVTGGSQGLGEGMAAGLTQAGASLVISSRTKDKLESVARRLRDYGGEVLAVPTDVTKKGDLEHLVSVTHNHFGKIDFLFNNAGIIYRCPSEDHSEDAWDEIINTNLKSVFLLSQMVGRIMIKQGGGTIVNTSSLISVSGGKRIPAYAASKGGVAQLTKALANDWAKYNIRVNAIGPGYFLTPNTEPLQNDQARFKDISDRIPMGRWGVPDDLAGVAVFLVSDAARYITGQTIFVDGGWLSL